MNRLVALHVGGAPEPWQAIGLERTDSGCRLADVDLLISGDTPGLLGWTISADRDAVVEIDGIPTTLVASAPVRPVTSRIMGQTIVGLDHVVVNTSDQDRTCAAFESVLGLAVRREREVGNGVVQRFLKLDNTILEIVSGPHVTGGTASLWGLVVSVDDLFDLADDLGDNVVSPPKKAVQPGRYISTVRGSVGLGTAVALMTPHVPGMPTR